MSNSGMNFGEGARRRILVSGGGSEFLEEVGVDVGEGDGADAGNLYDDVSVGADAPHIAFVTDKRSANHPHPVAFPKVFLPVDFTLPVGVDLGEQHHQLHLHRRDLLDPVAGNVAVDVEGVGGGGGSALFLELKGALFAGADKHQSGYHRSHGVLAVGATVDLLREVVLDIFFLQISLGISSAVCLEGIPVRVGFFACDTGV